jgi:SAM-dependent methyltransferase
VSDADQKRHFHDADDGCPTLVSTTVPVFSAHNIALPGGEQTCPAYGLIAESGVCRAALRTLQLVLPPDRVSSTSVVDLGCLEGGYAVAFAQAGYEVTGIEVRELNLERCRYVQERLALSNLRFVQDDVRNLGVYGPFDAVFCCGLFYHLDRPREFLELLGRCTRRVLILQTHFAEQAIPTGHAAALSEMTKNEGLAGRWYKEFDEGTSHDAMSESLWSSWGNHRSFWIEKRHLLQAMRDVGFDCVFEQFDFVDDLVNDSYWSSQGRSTFVGVKL